jgi:hypothetical protein
MNEKKLVKAIQKALGREVLQKDRGRITFPADPKITNRPDQEVVPASEHSVKYLGGKKNYAGGKSIGHPIDVNDPVGLGVAADIKSGNNLYGNMQPSGHNLKAFAMFSPKDPSAREHEGFHVLMNEITRKHGDDEAEKFLTHVLNSGDKDINDFIASNLNGSENYKKMSNHPEKRYRNAFKEEIINNVSRQGTKK